MSVQPAGDGDELGRSRPDARRPAQPDPRRSLDESRDRSLDRSLDQPGGRSLDQPPARPADQPVDQPADRFGDEVADQPGPVAVAPVAKPSNWNIANLLTLARIALVPGFIVLLLHDDGQDTWWRVFATLAFMLAMATDRVDGEIARRKGLITDLGKIADPIADKALVGGALIALSVLGELWWWVTALVLVRELGITLMRFVVIRHGVMPAGRGGKLKTVAQALALTLYLAPLPSWLDPVAITVMVVAVALTVGTGIDYVLQAIRLRRTSARTLAKRTQAV